MADKVEEKLVLVSWNTYKGNANKTEAKSREDYIVAYLQKHDPIIAFLQESLWNTTPPALKGYEKSRHPNEVKEVLLLYKESMLKPWLINQDCVSTEESTVNLEEITELFVKRATAVATKNGPRVGFVNVHFFQNAFNRSGQQGKRGQEKHAKKTEIIVQFLQQLIACHTSITNGEKRAAGSVFVAADWNIAMKKLKAPLDMSFGNRHRVHKDFENLGKRKADKLIDGLIEIWPEGTVHRSVQVKKSFYDNREKLQVAKNSEMAVKPEELFDHSPLRFKTTFQL